MKQYKLWLYGTTYVAQSKTKLVKKAMQDWDVIPVGNKIELFKGNKLISII